MRLACARRSNDPSSRWRGAELCSSGRTLHMDERDFLSIVASVRRIDGASVLDTPVRETTLDSLDLATLRSALEVRIGRPIGDDVWARAGTLRQLMDSLS